MQSEQSQARLNPKVFYPSSVAIIALMVFAFFLPQHADQLFSTMQAVIVENGSWFYVISVATILLGVAYLGVSRYGEVKLGPDHATPDYSLITWLSMLFAAGMGIGLMFFGVAEPLMHFLAPPNAEPNTVAAAKEAMKTTFFHWGLHAWAIYALVALVMAYFSFRHGLPLTLRSALYPIFGDKIYGWIGHTVDVFAVTSTIFGVATSLGIGASQINAGLAYVFGIEISVANQILLMIGVIAIAVVSVMSGLDKGIRRLSEANMILAVALLIFILALGPTIFLLQAFLQNTGAYLSDIVRNTFNLFAYEKTDWIGGWTIFYWGWWIAWAPFVGLFIARISRGRTIREFVLGVILIPSAFTLFWMTVFGNSAIDLVLNGDSQKLAEMVNDNSSVALFVFLDQFPFASLLSVIAIGMVVIFFVTSCDSGAMVVDMICSNGSNETPLWQRVYWAVSVGVVAMILMAAGGLSALQTMTIAAALPFAIILLLSMTGLVKALRVESYKRESMQLHAMPSSLSSNKESWQERLQNIVNFPNKKAVQNFFDNAVLPAFESVKSELQKTGIQVEIVKNDSALELWVSHGEEHDFRYGVHRKKHLQPDFVNTDNNSLDTDDEQSYYRAEVHLSEGGQDYDIMGWSTVAVINDIIDQYHKHLHFLHLLR
ncbi:BCCT family transporter [Alteromonas sediminis]|uniref:BCCT family transporter n=1 Tax=Alteromonas sediminis TaxID=2259342 RepID=A0A3N5Y1I6_9ALTE|nr:choline BCCT transporter BetT [Alteromonas sediminis]RPJ67020.1 BCCT family transporter [Alteromonas sediminis]